MSKPLSSMARGTKSLLLCLALVLPSGLRAGYVQVMSLDDLADGGDYVITSLPSLTGGYMLGNECADDAIPGIPLDETTGESDYVVWNITFRSGGKYGLSLDGKALGIDDSGHLLLGTSGSDYVSWTFSLADKGEEGAFQFTHNKAAGRVLAMFNTVGGNSRTEWKMYSVSGTSTPYLYVFKRVELDAPRFLTTATQFGETLEVEIEADEDCLVYYTTDGTTPTAGSMRYDGPISLSTTTTVKAIAVRDGEASAVAERTFTYCPPIVVNVGGGDHLGTLYSDYPLVPPAGVSLFVIERVDEAEGLLQLAAYEPATGTLPAAVPFIVQGEADTPCEFIFSPDEPGDVPDYAADIVRGTAERIAVPGSGQVLALGYGDDGVSFGFFPYEGETLPANRAYLLFPATSSYVWVDGEAGYVNGAQYVLASGCTDGQPSGYYAGAFDTNKLAAVAFSDDAVPYQWTLTGRVDNVKLVDEEGNKLSAASSGTNLSLNGANETWKLSFEEGGAARLSNTVDDTRCLGYHSTYGIFRNYSNTMNASLYLFRLVDETPASAALGYSFSWPGAATGIPSVDIPGAADGYYDLQGRRVASPVRGVYVRRGRKVYVK